MTPTRFVLIGVGLFLVMTLVAFFARDETVETDLHNRIQLAVLQEPNVAFEVDHLDVELAGHVTSATHRDDIQSQVAHIYGVGRVSNSSMTVVPNPPVRSLPIDSEPFTPAAPVEDLPDPTLQPEPIDQLPDRSKTSAIMNPVSGENGQAQEGQATERQPLPNAEGSVTADPITNDAAPGNVPSSQKNTEEQTELTIQPSNDSDSETANEVTQDSPAQTGALAPASATTTTATLIPGTNAGTNESLEMASLPVPQLPVPLNLNREPELARPIPHAN